MLRKLVISSFSIILAASVLLPGLAWAEAQPRVGDPATFTTVDRTAKGLFQGLTVACFRDGSCTLCDALVVFINVANNILRLLAIVATIFFVYGAGLMMLSQGNEDWVDRGKKAMKATVVGVIITLSAWQIMSVVVWVLSNRQAEVFADRQGRTAVTEGYNPITSWYKAAEQCAQVNLESR